MVLKQNRERRRKTSKLDRWARRPCWSSGKNRTRPTAKSSWVARLFLHFSANSFPVVGGLCRRYCRARHRPLFRAQRTEWKWETQNETMKVFTHARNSHAFDFGRVPSWRIPFNCFLALHFIRLAFCRSVSKFVTKLQRAPCLLKPALLTLSPSWFMVMMLFDAWKMTSNKNNSESIWKKFLNYYYYNWKFDCNHRDTKCFTRPIPACRSPLGTLKWSTTISWRPSATWRLTRSTRFACRPRRVLEVDRCRHPFRSRPNTAYPVSRPDWELSTFRQRPFHSNGLGLTTPAKMSTATNSTGTTRSPK